ncbi:MAG: DUF2490 domain-containing protein [Bacteroidota bacterium]
MKNFLKSRTSKYVLVILFNLVIFTVQGQRQTVNQYNTWYMYFGNHRLSEHWLLHTEYQFRRSGFITDWQQSLARIGLDYRFNKELTLTAGYAYIQSFPYGELPISEELDEHRIWQTLTVNQFFNGWILNHRYRLEQRWNERASSSEENGRIYRNRIRYRAMVTVPLNNKTMQKGTLFLSAYDEIFIGFGENVSQAFDQNRLYFALGHQFNDSGNVQLGYLNQIALKGDGINQEQNHTLMLAITYNLDLRKQ